MNVIVNGDARRLDDGATVARLLDELELTGKHVAVEVNLDLVPHGQHGAHTLSDGDRVEIVTLVGGG